SCSERLVAAGVAEVVYACDDPSPQASHLGPQRLKDAGVRLRAGLLDEDADHLIAPSRHHLATGRPMVRIADEPNAFDAEFTADATSDLTAELAAWAAKGYRNLYVRSGTELALRMAELGYLTE
ncbi:MAG: cytidine deaminase, partial [Asticcacaulis sp.]|nr:cytidine deaminase [Asticcacaulis sp.]